MNELQEKLRLILHECNQHKIMINHAFKYIEPYVPLTAEKYQKLSLDEIGYIDQFLFRFAKLQDSIGEKLFGTMLYLLGEDFSKKPFIDVLNRLEKMELLNKDEWLTLRALRNNVAHEYGFDIDELVIRLNAIFMAKDTLLALYERIYSYCKSRFDFMN